MQEFVCINGKFLKTDQAHLSIDNRSFRYGDGCFETMKLLNGVLLLKDYHFERLFNSLGSMYYNLPSLFTPDYLEQCILQLAAKSKCTLLARIRLTVYRGEGGLYDPTNNQPHFMVQSWPLSSTTNAFNSNGLDVGIYRHAVKVIDQFSGIKSNSFLCYALGAQWAKQKRLNDCILLNPKGTIADATIANFFAIKEGVVITPPLSDGPVDGVMRRHLLATLKQAGVACEEKSIKPEELASCDELFLTNAIAGIKWIAHLDGKNYGCTTTAQLYQQCIAPLFTSKTS